MSGFGAFGQPSSAFGGPSSTFGAPSAFGQSSQSAFGSSTFGGTGGLFGQSAQQQQNTGFGAFGQSAPAFGSSVFGGSAPQSASAFGSGAFGGAAFASSQPTFGASGAFGASSQPAFGSTGASFGGGASSLFGGSAAPTGGFGAAGSTFGQSQPAWGTTSSSAAFGASGAFGAASGGGGLFGNPSSGSSLFGNQATPGFGSSQGQTGTGGVTWQVTVEYDTGNPSLSSKYQAISMMPQFRDKSLEELRAEDYAAGNKGSTAAAGGGSLFGQSAPSGGLFGSGGTFGSTGGGGGFGTTGSAFGQTQSGFGSTQGGLFGGSSGFGSTGGFGQSSAPAFGGSGFGQSSGGLFGQSASGFGAQSGSAFGAGSGGLGSTSGFGTGATGFGSSGAGFGSGATGFGAGGGGFGSGAGGFGTGGGGFGSTGGFGGSGFGASNPQSGGNLFGQPNTGGAFGTQPSQSLFGSQPQSGASLFGSSTAPAGGSLFGAQTTSNLFGGAQQGNLFGGGAQSQQSLFGSNAQAQKPLFGTGAPAGGFSTAGLGQQAGGGSLFGSTGAAFGQSAPSTGFGLAGTGFGAQPIPQQQAPQGLFGAPGGQVGQSALGTGFNPTLQSTYNAVAQEGGGTVAPPGANYGTVLHNLQKLRGGLEEQKRLLEQQAKEQADKTRQQQSLSIVVLPSPPLVKLSANRLSGSIGQYGYSSRTPNRTKMRGVVGRISGANSKVSGTPLKLPDTEVKEEPQPTGTPMKPSPAVRRMPFFSPQQFSGSRRRALRSAEITTPHRSSPFPLPLPVPESDDRAPSSNGGTRERRDTVRLLAADDDESLREEDAQANANGISSPTDTPERVSRRNAVSGSNTPTHETAEEQTNGSANGSQRKTSGVKGTREDFMWSSSRPSAWSMSLPVDSDEQYNAGKYLPVLTKEGFYTKPSMAELASRSMKELQFIENFTVGRKGYGEIKWSDPVDVRGLDLDLVVDIQKGEIAVYPDRLADQLDAPATVTLEGMFKKDKRSGTPTTDKQATAKYARKLESFCENNNLRFKEYNPESGRWSFEVEGFAEQ